MLGPQRFSQVPWLWFSDLEEGRRALWELDYARERDVASCWAVTVYTSRDVADQYLVVHASRGNGNDGGTITLAIHDSPHFDVYAKEVFALQQATTRSRRWRTSSEKD